MLCTGNAVNMCLHESLTLGSYYTPITELLPNFICVLSHNAAYFPYDKLSRMLRITSRFHTETGRWTLHSTGCDQSQSTQFRQDEVSRDEVR